MSDTRAVQRFLQRYAVSPREAVRRDVAPYVGVSLADKARDLAAVCRGAMAMLEGAPHRRRALDYRDPPHPSYRAIIERLGKGYVFAAVGRGDE